VAMYFHLFPTESEREAVRCGCALHPGTVAA
jgi:hypothetical protein